MLRWLTETSTGGLFHRETLVSEPLFNKVVTPTQVFSCEIWEIFITHLLKNIFERLLLDRSKLTAAKTEKSMTRIQEWHQSRQAFYHSLHVFIGELLNSNLLQPVMQYVSRSSAFQKPLAHFQYFHKSIFEIFSHWFNCFL